MNQITIRSNTNQEFKFNTAKELIRFLELEQEDNPYLTYYLVQLIQDDEILYKEEVVANQPNIKLSEDSVINLSVDLVGFYYAYTDALQNLPKWDNFNQVSVWVRSINMGGIKMM